MAQSDGHDSPGLIDEIVPSLAAVVDEIVVGFKDAVGEPAAISTRCRFIASVLQVGRIRAAPLPSFGQTAPKM